MSVTEYRVRLDAFEGPLDLLLYLIRKSEVDIHDIPVARITDQYMAALKADGGVERLDIETAGEFLVMAATLMEIKSRMLSPKPKAAPGEDAGEMPQSAAEELDPRADLVQKLLAYKRYRDAATALEHRHDQWHARVAAAAAGIGEQADQPAQAADEPVDLDDLQITDLVEAFARIMSTVDFAKVGDHHVFDDETPIQLHAEDLLEQLRQAAAAFASLNVAPDGDQRPGVELRRVFTGRTKAEAVGLFLAMLELIRQRKVRVKQDAINERIWVELGEVE